MTEEVKNYIETNYELLDSALNEFFMTAYNGLSIHQQGELIKILNEAGVDFEDSRDAVLRFILTRGLGDLERPVFLQTYIDRYLKGILGYDNFELHQFILDESTEFDIDIVVENNDYKIYPRVRL